MSGTDSAVATGATGTTGAVGDATPNIPFKPLPNASLLIVTPEEQLTINN
ncbi:hypothetical protein FACS1894139_06230 [Planctomycetales bacterium]|nr:hypothetical protein FACS1894107_08020 [Planctomycetales bacterium]GHS96128.1 hypothetical protein FACS1894108_00210 [Planctomycetales bacterium]GHT04300.1 hypothetical protein FACS1894139_06230 [Planctomycetales bacterium]GHV19503.1 hypothetical protein AGMMS49959_04640 [Planctomycetales bacterium]